MRGFYWRGETVNPALVSVAMGRLHRSPADCILEKNTALILVFLTLTITFFLPAAKNLFAMPVAGIMGGYFGLITAALAAWLAAGEIINESFGRSAMFWY